MSVETALPRFGYIGPSSVDTNKLKDSIEQVLVAGKSVVFAEQRKVPSNS
jgi:hypothetical protein